MGLTPTTETVARTLAIFGVVALVATFGTALYKASLVDDVWERSDTFATPGEPASSSDATVRGDVQDIATVNGWERALLLLAIGSLLAGILLTFAISVYRGVKLLRSAFPTFWASYLRAHTGRDVPVADSIDDDVPLPFGGGA